MVRRKTRMSQKVTWKLCPSWPHVEASNTGLVRVVSSGRILIPYLSGDYLAVKVLRKTVYVHQAVADAFHGPCPDGEEVNHINEIKTANGADNLEYLTHAENMRRWMEQATREDPLWRFSAQRRRRLEEATGIRQKPARREKYTATNPERWKRWRAERLARHTSTGTAKGKIS